MAQPGNFDPREFKGDSKREDSSCNDGVKKQDHSESPSDETLEKLDFEHITKQLLRMYLNRLPIVATERRLAYQTIQYAQSIDTAMGYFEKYPCWMDFSAAVNHLRQFPQSAAGLIEIFKDFVASRVGSDHFPDSEKEILKKKIANYIDQHKKYQAKQRENPPSVQEALACAPYKQDDKEAKGGNQSDLNASPPSVPHPFRFSKQQFDEIANTYVRDLWRDYLPLWDKNSPAMQKIFDFSKSLESELKAGDILTLQHWVKLVNVTKEAEVLAKGKARSEKPIQTLRTKLEAIASTRLEVLQDILTTLNQCEGLDQTTLHAALHQSTLGDETDNYWKTTKLELTALREEKVLTPTIIRRLCHQKTQSMNPQEISTWRADSLKTIRGWLKENNLLLSKNLEDFYTHLERSCDLITIFQRVEFELPLAENLKKLQNLEPDHVKSILRLFLRLTTKTKTSGTDIYLQFSVECPHSTLPQRCQWLLDAVCAAPGSDVDIAFLKLQSAGLLSNEQYRNWIVKNLQHATSLSGSIYKLHEEKLHTECEYVCQDPATVDRVCDAVLILNRARAFEAHRKLLSLCRESAHYIALILVRLKERGLDITNPDNESCKKLTSLASLSYGSKVFRMLELYRVDSLISLDTFDKLCKLCENEKFVSEILAIFKFLRKCKLEATLYQLLQDFLKYPQSVPAFRKGCEAYNTIMENDTIRYTDANTHKIFSALTVFIAEHPEIQGQLVEKLFIAAGTLCSLDLFNLETLQKIYPHVENSKEFLEALPLLKKPYIKEKERQKYLEICSHPGSFKSLNKAIYRLKHTCCPPSFTRHYRYIDKLFNPKNIEILFYSHEHVLERANALVLLDYADLENDQKYTEAICKAGLYTDALAYGLWLLKQKYELKPTYESMLIANPKNARGLAHALLEFTTLPISVQTEANLSLLSESAEHASQIAMALNALSTGGALAANPLNFCKICEWSHIPTMAADLLTLASGNN